MQMLGASGEIEHVAIGFSQDVYVLRSMCQSRTLISGGTEAMKVPRLTVFCQKRHTDIFLA